LAQQYGVCQTAKTLRLSYYWLKEHMQVGAAEAGNPPRTASFVELLSWSPSARPECSVELENVRGAKMKIQLHGAAVGELCHLTRLFWREL
jgi:hypothetical protein